jgi:co-chaperonin GroES (HSP10)
MLNADQLPAQPRGSRILVRPLPPVEESEIIITPDDQKRRPNKGTIVAAGLTALDQLHDHGDRLGDLIWWGKFAGVMEEHDHLVTPGAKDCSHSWVRTPDPHPHNRSWECSQPKCGARRQAELLLVMNADDILANESLARRLEQGAVEILRSKTANGQTQHYIERKDQ